MNRILSSALLFFIIGSFSFLSAQNDVSDAKKYIEEMNKKIESAMIQGDIEAMNDYYADDIISLPSYEPMIKGKSKMMQKAKKEHDSGMKFNSVKFKTLEVFGSGNHVYEIGEYDITMVMPEMPQPMSDQGKYLTVWEKESDGKWKAVAEMWNTNNNPWTGGDKKEDMMKKK